VSFIPFSSFSERSYKSAMLIALCSLGKIKFFKKVIFH
jgi:hypothetical protein